MCAICGSCYEASDPVAERRLVERMSDRLAHRGPDGSGLHAGEGAVMGHRRLAIIDLSTGDQPIFNEDGSIAIVFNGEIYNYKELRADLIARGHRFTTQSDTEVIVHLYEERGDDCVHALNGMFAFALWDQPRRRLLAARDRLGEKPFYYRTGAGRLVFASELKALLLDPATGRDVDLGSLDDFLAYGYIPAPGTIFRGVQKLRAGELLVWENGRATPRIYWSPKGGGGGARRSDREYVDELRHLVEDSVRLRLRSDVPVGAFLSGGLDSSGIVAFASRQLSRPIETFSVSFGRPDFDETPLARLTSERYHTNHHDLVVTDSGMIVFDELVAHFDEPFADPSMLPTYFIAREASRAVKVCLSGDAGDEVFGGYTHYVDALRYARADTVPAAVREPLGQALSAVLPDSVPGKGLLRRLSASGAARYQRQIGVFDLIERRRLLRPDLGADPSEARLFEPFFPEGDTGLLHTLQLVDQHTYLPDDVLVKVDRASMKNGLEVRVPFLDHRIVDLANAMPDDLKIRDGVQKWVLREVIGDLVPSEVLRGRKRGFGPPIQHWFRDNLRATARDLLLSGDSQSSAFLRPAAVDHLLSSHDRGGRDLSDRIWTLLVLEQWCRSVNSSPGA